MKKLITLALAIMMVLAIAACGGGKTDPAPSGGSTDPGTSQGGTGETPAEVGWLDCYFTSLVPQPAFKDKVASHQDTSFDCYIEFSEDNPVTYAEMFAYYSQLVSAGFEGGETVREGTTCNFNGKNAEGTKIVLHYVSNFPADTSITIEKS